MKNKKKLIKKFDEVLKLAITDFDCSIDDIKIIKNRRDELMNELIENKLN